MRETLLTVQTNTGDVFGVDVGSGEISKVAFEGQDADLLFGDGLLRIGGELYAARNACQPNCKAGIERRLALGRRRSDAGIGSGKRLFSERHDPLWCVRGALEAHGMLPVQ